MAQRVTNGVLSRLENQMMQYDKKIDEIHTDVHTLNKKVDNIASTVTNLEKRQEKHEGNHKSSAKYKICLAAIIIIAILIIGGVVAASHLPGGLF